MEEVIGSIPIRSTNPISILISNTPEFASNGRHLDAANHRTSVQTPGDKDAFNKSVFESIIRGVFLHFRMRTSALQA